MSDSQINGFILKILKSTATQTSQTGQMLIFVHRPFASLISDLTRTFKGKEDVKIAIDRRNGERRQQKHPVELERRHSDRRKPRAQLLEVVFLA